MASCTSELAKECVNEKLLSFRQFQIDIKKHKLPLVVVEKTPYFL
jgi:hypothetical protein